MLTLLRPGASDVGELLSSHLGPAIEARWAARRPSPRQVRELQFGTPPTDPRCTVVVPLHGRHDFLLYQLSAFARDPEMAGADLIYVIDDPAIRDATVRLARDISPLWPVPFRVIDPGTNLGYAGANNLAASRGRGDLLLLLNSDVLPDRPGWLGRLDAKLDALPRCGVLAPRLLFEDGSIQHDGITFRPHPRVPSIWINDHPGKGLPVSLAASQEDEVVPAVTGACMLLRRQTYLELGGLDEGYVMGDFEDSDLCLRLREQGLRTYVVRDESLYHLEGMSRGHAPRSEWRPRVTLYNAWRHTRRWEATLREVSS
jgi:GT2 family glycosyltransferase